ncbi:MAG TPA: hypothetical protein VHA52_02210 [Candidatus Babeliaceae bacterium]|nr:hypothetical protein [Candidatus Babeliaceae bacterium]
MKKSNNIKLNAEKTPSRVFETVLDIFTLKQRPVSIAFIEQLAQQSVKSALEIKNDLKSEQFFRKLGYGSNSIKRWRERSPKFAELYDLRKEILADKREIGAALKDPDKEYLRLNESFIKYTHSLYDKEFKELEAEKAALHNKDEKPEKIVVVIDKFEE